MTFDTALPSRILITGAAGYLGTILRNALHEDAVSVRLTDLRDPDYALDRSEDFRRADLASMSEVTALVEGVDAIVHLGACSIEAAWEDILPFNIVGTYNVFEAARAAGVKRVVFASTQHVAGFYRRDRVIDNDVPPRPDSRYAVSKVFGEALGRLYADKHAMSVVCQRIGVACARPPHRRGLRAWLSEADFVRLTRRCLTAPDVHFRVVYGVSANTGRFWEDNDAAAIGYWPEDSAEAYRAAVEAEPDDEPEIERLFQGGWYCGMEFDGDPERIS